jgi:hypothetical protein
MIIIREAPMGTITSEFWSLVDRYYDPSSDEFLSVDPLVGITGQPYVFTGDDPLNKTDPLGLSAISPEDMRYDEQHHVLCGHRGERKCWSLSHDLVHGADNLRHYGHDVAHGVNLGATDAQAFGEDHISVSAEVCFESCVGIVIQQGRFQAIQGSGGYLFGAGASLNVTSGPPDPNGSSSDQVGLGPGSISYGPGGARSVGIGPGYVFGFGGQSTSSEFGP